MRILSRLAVLAVASAVAGGATVVHARQQPPLSPREVHEFDVGDCHVTFHYGRPSKRGRQIWGRLVPWGQWWMPGADQATSIATTKAIAFDGLVMPAGEHTIYMLPSATASELVINNQVGQFHLHYEPARDLGHVKFPWRAIDPIVEQLTFAVASTPSGAELTLTWDNRQYYASFTVQGDASRELPVSSSIGTGQPSVHQDGRSQYGAMD